MRKTLKAAANLRGFVVNRQVELERQRELLDAISPVETEHPLIRIGGVADGGYLIPDDLDGIAACFSPGVSDQASFEEDLLARGIRCFQIDASVERSPVEAHPLVEFERKFLGPTTEGEFITLADWVGEKQVRGDLLLQMDIEGAEWLVLTSTPDSLLKRFRIICLEFHGLEHIFEPFAFNLMEKVLLKLARQFDVVHIHPNNWCDVAAVSKRYRVPGVMEYTFLRRDRVKRRTAIAKLPHPLDQDCRPGAPPVQVPASMLSR
ncbi:MAG: hypothetical protein HOP91_09560 [Sphingomonas sp.]|nr:hypothetical protein [Sphingomonas sp.]